MAFCDEFGSNSLVATIGGGHAVSFLEQEKKGEPFKINLKALEDVLYQVGERKFAIFSVNGKQGIGKSFLLNYMLKFLSQKVTKRGSNEESSIDLSKLEELDIDWMIDVKRPNYFRYHNGVHRTTVGIQLWSKPLIVVQDNEEIAIILMDCQGDHENDASTADSQLVFAFSAFLSDVMIYNCQGKVTDSVDVQFIRLFAEAARILKKAGDKERRRLGNEDEESFSRNDLSGFEIIEMPPFPHLLVLVRDFLPVIENKKYVYYYGYYKTESKPSEDLENYKIDKLDPKRENCASDEACQKRQELHELFESVSCFLLPNPGKKIAKDNTNEMFTGSMHDMKPEFREYLDVFMKTIFKAYNFECKSLSTSALLQVVGVWQQEFLEKFCDKMPKATDLSDAMAIFSNQRVMEHNYEQYVLVIEAFVKNKDGEVVSEPQLVKEHSDQKKKSLNDFVQNIYKGGNEKLQKTFKEELERKIKVYYDAVFVKNRWMAEEATRTAKEEAFAGYKNGMSEVVGTEDNPIPSMNSDLLSKHLNEFKKALDTFERLQKGDLPDKNSKFQKPLIAEIEKAFESIRKRNIVVSEVANAKAFNDNKSNFKTAVKTFIRTFSGNCVWQPDLIKKIDDEIKTAKSNFDLAKKGGDQVTVDSLRLKLQDELNQMKKEFLATNETNCKNQLQERVIVLIFAVKYFLRELYGKTKYKQKCEKLFIWAFVQFWAFDKIGTAKMMSAYLSKLKDQGGNDVRLIEAQNRPSKIWKTLKFGASLAPFAGNFFDAYDSFQAARQGDAKSAAIHGAACVGGLALDFLTLGTWSPLKTGLRMAGTVLVETAKSGIKGICKGALLSVQNIFRLRVAEIFEKIGERAAELKGAEPSQEYDVNQVNVLSGRAFTLEALKSFRENNQSMS